MPSAQILEFPSGRVRARQNMPKRLNSMAVCAATDVVMDPSESREAYMARCITAYLEEAGE